MGQIHLGRRVKHYLLPLAWIRILQVTLEPLLEYGGGLASGVLPPGDLTCAAGLVHEPGWLLALAALLVDGCLSLLAPIGGHEFGYLLLGRLNHRGVVSASCRRPKAARARLVMLLMLLVLLVMVMVMMKVLALVILELVRLAGRFDLVVQVRQVEGRLRLVVADEVGP